MEGVGSYYMYTKKIAFLTKYTSPDNLTCLVYHVNPIWQTPK